MPEEIPITQYLGEMRQTITRFEKKLDENTKLTGEIGTQVAVANGRTRKLEDFSNETKNTLEILTKAVSLNHDENILIQQTAKSKDTTIKWIIGIIAFFIVGFAVMLQDNIKNYNLNLINQQLNAQKKTENSSNVTNNVTVNPQ